MFKSSILSFPNYRKLYLAGLTSELGSFITDSALMLYLFSITNDDKSFMGINRAVFLFFLTMGSLFGGVLGERINRKKLLIYCEVARLPLIFLFFFTSDAWSLVILNGLIALFTGIFKPARQTIVNDIVPDTKIKEANSLFGSTFAIIHIIGPIAGAGLYTAFKGINEIIIFDIITYIVGIYLLYRMNYKEPKKGTAPQANLIQDISGGFKYAMARSELRCVLINSIVLGASIGMLIPLFLPFIKDVLGKTDFYYGLFIAAFGFGGVIGSAIAVKLSKRFSTSKIILVCVALEAVFFLLWIRFSHFEINSFINFLWGIAVFVRITSQLNYLSETVETEYLTRIYSLLELCFIVPNVAAGILIGVIGSRLTTYEILNWTSIVFIIVVVIRMFLPETKKLWNSDIKQVYRDPNSFDKIQ